MTDATLAWRVEEACFDAFPALKQALLDGWLLRFSAGLSRRANSANPLRADCRDLRAAIGEIEALYRRHGLPTIVRVPSFIAPSFEEPLVARGYADEGESCVLYGDIPPAADLAVELSPHATAEWIAAMSTLQKHTPEQRRIYRRIVRGIAVPVAFAGLRVDGRLAALAYAAVHDGLLCYESVITDPRRRRHGLARRVIGGLAAWGRGEGARGICLQVEAHNAPARALYKEIGLEELYRYHYRRMPG